MKTKVYSFAVSLLFLVACGSSDKPAEDTATSVAPAVAPVKFTLKASNMMYVTMDKDSMLAATEAVPTKALVFEKIDNGNGKISLRLSNGRYITDKRSDGFDNLIAVNSWAAEWEFFETISLNDNKINLKSSQGKFVYVAGVENRLYANANDASDVAVFSMEIK